MHDHAFRALRGASAAAVSGEMRSALVSPSAKRVVAVNAVVVEATSQVVAHWHSATFKTVWVLLRLLKNFIAESLRALVCLGLLLLCLLVLVLLLALILRLLTALAVGRAVGFLLRFLVRFRHFLWG